MARLLLLLLALVGAARAELKVEAFTDAGCVAANRVNQSTIQQNACMEIGSPPLPAGMFGSGRLNCSEATADSAWAMAVHFLRPGCGGSPNLVTTGVSGVCKNFPLGPVGTVSFIVNCGPPKVDCQVGVKWACSNCKARRNAERCRGWPPRCPAWATLELAQRAAVAALEFASGWCSRQHPAAARPAHPLLSQKNVTLPRAPWTARCQRSANGLR